jgi:hypothetical protein
MINYALPTGKVAVADMVRTPPAPAGRPTDMESGWCFSEAAAAHNRSSQVSPKEAAASVALVSLSSIEQFDSVKKEDL